MGLDVGVVTIEYLERPGQPMYGFLQDLVVDPGMGWEDDDTWGGSWDNNGLYEFNRVGLRKRANNWANNKRLGQAEKVKLRRWINSLPWQDDLITLHLGN